MGSQWWTQIVHLADTLQERATWHVPCEPSSNHFVFQVWRIVYLEPLERIFFFFNRPFRSVRAQWNRCHSKKSWQSTLLFLDLRRKSFWRILGKLKEKKGRKMADILAYYIAIYGHYDDCCDHYSSCLGRLTFSASGTSLLLRFSWNTESTKRERGAAVAAAPGGLTCLFSLFN